MKRNIFISYILMLLIICTSCSNQTYINEKPKPSIVQSASPIQTMLPTITAEANDKSYKFYDESIKKTVETYFDKTADKLTENDFASLKKLNYLIVEEPVESIKDIPNLFPSIEYLSVSSRGIFSKDDLNIIASIKSLKALSLVSYPIPDSYFAKDLLYLEIKYQEDKSMTSKNNLGAYSVLGQSVIDENFDRPINKFVRIIDNDKFYELVCSDYFKGESEFYYEQERKIFVSERNNERIVLKSILDCTGDVGDAISGKLYLADVDFDGKKDILTDNGHFGNQGFVTFTCFLNENGQYTKCDSFSNIINPSVDTGNKKILSTWRNRAASHSWAMYSYDEVQYIMTDCLTEEAVIPQQEISPQMSKTDKETWKYTIEKLKGDNMQEIESFTTNDYTDKQIDEKIFNENSFWGLSSDKWKTLFNTGKMSDFSIYGDDSINDTILDIIDS